mmetsp:Transcript_27311/g.69509  ORF Transcript_27311/g.69509 Transcript_27311/m.69509 type:complete len:214 (+) Transcript_27311:399-1040(+)
MLRPGVRAGARPAAGGAKDKEMLSGRESSPLHEQTPAQGARLATSGAELRVLCPPFHAMADEFYFHLQRYRGMARDRVSILGRPSAQAHVPPASVAQHLEGAARCKLRQPFGRGGWGSLRRYELEWTDRLHDGLLLIITKVVEDDLHEGAVVVFTHARRMPSIANHFRRERAAAQPIRVHLHFYPCPWTERQLGLDIARSLFARHRRGVDVSK